MGPAAGVTPAQFQAILEQGTLLKRLPTLAEVADTAAFIASDHASAMTATVANLSAGSITDERPVMNTFNGRISPLRRTRCNIHDPSRL
jgi:NAD(P)-dependent dehydrogenase (short-subunit alcohol dehydrogenase family)